MPPPKLHPMLYVLLGVLGLLSLMIVAPLWSWVFGGLLLGYLGHPLYRRISRDVKRRSLAAAIALLLMMVMILVPLSYMGYQLVIQARGLAEGFTAGEVRELLETSTNFTRSNFGWPAVQENETGAEAVIDEVVPRARQAFLNWLPNAATYVGQMTLGIFVAVFVGYYTIKDGDKLVAFVEEALPLRPTTEKELIAEARGALDAVLIGQLLTALIQGSLLGLGFWVFGVPVPIFWAFVATVLSVLPVIGPPFVWGPAALFLIATGDTFRGIGLLIWGAVLVSTSDNIIKPKLMEAHSGMHPTIALLGVLGGLISFGFVGFIVGPVILALFLMLVHVYIDHRYEVLDFQRASGRPDPDWVGEPESEEGDEGDSSRPE